MTKFKNKKYLTLFLDSLKLIDLAEQCDTDTASTLYRSSILINSISLECAANICIDSLKLPIEIYDQIEKMSIIGKFDFYAYQTVGCTLDKSRNEFSNLKSMVSLRNDCVHPKVEGGSVTKDYEQVYYGSKKSFSMSNDIRVWGKSEAVDTILAQVTFLNYFFSSLCNLTKGQSNTILTMHESLNTNGLIESCVAVSDATNLLIEKYLGRKLMYMDLRLYTSN